MQKPGKSFVMKKLGNRGHDVISHVQKPGKLFVMKGLGTRGHDVITVMCKSEVNSLFTYTQYIFIYDALTNYLLTGIYR